MPFRLVFRSHSGTPIADPALWMREWSADFPQTKYPSLDALIRKPDLTAADFEYLGQWKDNALGKVGRWRANVASVAFHIWMQAASELPGGRIARADVPSFLAEWSSRTYVDRFSTRTVSKCFGLPRATTLLHALSGGEYPIFDKRVRLAFKRLTGQAAGKTVDWYLSSYVPFFSQLVAECRAEDLKLVDNALFAYGRRESIFP